MDKQSQIQALLADWASNPRWKGINRPYTAEEVVSLRGSVQIEYTLARRGAEALWEMVNTPVAEDAVTALGCITGNQAIQAVEAGLRAIYCSGWQVAADGNTAETMYPDQSLYPADAVPAMLRRINNALQRADQIHWMQNKTDKNWIVPIVADAEAGFGGNLNAYELMRAMIIAGASGVHYEDQLSSAKKCGHLGGKVLVPTQEAVQKLIAARLAADVLGVPTVLIARTDAESATLITSDVDPVDRPFITGERSSEGFYYVKEGIESCIARGLAYAPYADMIWMETSTPNIEEAAAFAAGVRSQYPDKLLAYNCSPSFNWQSKLTEDQIRTFREDIAALGFKFQFITLAGWHALNNSMFELATDYVKDGMWGYSRLQQREFANAKDGYRADKHQSFVGTGYFDLVQNVVTGGLSSTVALAHSTESAQFH